MSDLRLTTYPGEVIIAVDPQVEQLQRQVGELKEALWKIGARGHNEDCLFCGFKDAIAKEALDKP